MKNKWGFSVMRSPLDDQIEEQINQQSISPKLQNYDSTKVQNLLDVLKVLQTIRKEIDGLVVTTQDQLKEASQ